MTERKDKEGTAGGSVFTCSVCHYTFQSPALPEACPGRGKKKHLGRPAVRPATEKEIEEFKKNRSMAEKEDW